MLCFDCSELIWNWVSQMSQMTLWSTQALLQNSLIHVCHLFQSCKWHVKALSKETTLLHGNKNKEIFLLMLVHLVFTVVHRDREALWSGGTTNLKQDGNILTYALITAKVSNYMVLNVIFYWGFIILSSTGSKTRWEEAGMMQKYSADNSHNAAF